MTDVESDSGKIDYNDHPFNVLNVEDSILRLPFYMGEEYADDVALEEPSRGHGIEVSLKDIITGDRVAYPGRGNRCDHIEIVDLMTSVRPAQTLVDSETLELSPPWRCPRCGLVYNCCANLEVDEWLQKILQQTTDTSVRLYLNGSWADSAGLYVLGAGGKDSSSSRSSEDEIDLTTNTDGLAEPKLKRRKQAELDELTPEVDLISCESDDDDAPGNITAIVDLDADD